MAWGLSAGERGAATAGLGSGQGVQGVLLRWDRGAGERQQGERREAQPPGDEEEGGRFSGGANGETLSVLGRAELRRSLNQIDGGILRFPLEKHKKYKRLQRLYNTAHYSSSGKSNIMHINIIPSFLTTEMHL